MRLKTMSEVLLENLDKQDIPDSIPTPGVGAGKSGNVTTRFVFGSYEKKLERTFLSSAPPVMYNIFL